MYRKNIDEVLLELKSSRAGIGIEEAFYRQKVYGKNELKKEKKQSIIKRFFKQFLNIMVAILLLSAVVSISFAIINHEYADLFEGFVILFIVIMNAIIGVYQESKAEACLNDLQKYNKVNVRVLRSNTTQVVDSSELVPGDIVEMSAGNIVMADIRLIEVVDFACDESSLTGESVPVEKSIDKINKPAVISERSNMAYSGSMVTNGRAKGVVVSTGNNTELGKIANVLFHSKKETTPLQKSIDKIGKIITWTVLIVCLAIFAIELVSGNGIKNAIMISISLAVAAIPESLPAVITIILALGVQQLAKRRCIIKQLHAVETLGSCQVICTDKTGTLTMNKMQIVDTYTECRADMLTCMRMCNNVKREKDVLIGEPTEKAIFEYSESTKRVGKIIHEIPFNSTRKMMTVIINNNSEISSFSKGAPEILIKKCKYIKINDKIVEFSQELKEKIKKINNSMTDKALRVIAFAKKNYTGFDINEEFEEDMVFLGLAGMKDNPRPEVKDGVKKCFDAGLKPVMITGDHKGTAFAIAKELGIAKNIEEVITGEELDKLSDRELVKRCHKYTVYARVSPEHKVRIVKAYKGLNKIVAMTGDGVNDAPSLKIADIGVGMGLGGSDVVKNVSDLVITDDNFNSIVIAVEEGRKIYNNIQKTLQFLISTNCVEVFGMLISLIFFPQYTFLMPVQMLFVNLVTDSLPAFALGMENVEKEVMMSPPRNPKAGLFGGKTGIGIIYQAIVQTVIVLTVFVVGVYCYTPEIATTMTFFTIIFMQLLHSINCKTNGSVFEKNLFDNRTFNICFLITLGINLLVACVPFMYTLFGLVYLDFSQWLLVIIASILIIPLCELFKVILIKEKINKNN
ncbi:MAG: cation-translocating P-type ATPase [Clostridia bacterium]|nr:cation-translocating P-type ATPase [Clostridia bacterium]